MFHYKINCRVHLQYAMLCNFFCKIYNFIS